VKIIRRHIYRFGRYFNSVPLVFICNFSSVYIDSCTLCVYVFIGSFQVRSHTSWLNSLFVLANNLTYIHNFCALANLLFYGLQNYLYEGSNFERTITKHNLRIEFQ
jgi:hypothetical protein